MRELSLMETEYLSGAGGELLGLTGIEEGLMLARVAGVVAGSFAFGYMIGGYLNDKWAETYGNTVGVSIYNWWNC